MYSVPITPYVSSCYAKAAREEPKWDFQRVRFDGPDVPMPQEDSVFGCDLGYTLVWFSAVSVVRRKRKPQPIEEFVAKIAERADQSSDGLIWASYKIVVEGVENRMIRGWFDPSLPKNEKERPNALARGLPMHRTCDTKRSLPGRRPFRGSIFLYVSESFS